MNMSPVTRKVLSFASSIIWAVLDCVIYQVIFSFALAVCAESAAFEVRVFMTGIAVLCWLFGGLYSLKSLTGLYMIDITRSGILAAFLSVLFAMCSEEVVPLTSAVISLAGFSAVSMFIRYSLRHVLAEGLPEFFRFFRAGAAYAAEGPSGEIDTSLRKDYRYNMKAVLRRKSRIYLAVKRLFDILSSGLALIVLSPVFLLTAIAIKIEDGGPVFFSAKRYGKNMTTFHMLKFRSMIPDAESKIKELLKNNEMTGHTFKIKDDPRITRVGHFIRKYSIDELPQLWNIFTGDMSVVGPRAIMTVGTDSIDDYDKQRWLVRPGLTCYWQVSGRADVKWEQWIEMDLDYIENMSVLEDVKLILKTIPVVFKAEGAY